MTRRTTNRLTASILGVAALCAGGGLVMTRHSRREAARSAAIAESDSAPAEAPVGRPAPRIGEAPGRPSFPPSPATMPEDVVLAQAETRFDEAVGHLDPALRARLEMGTPLGKKIARLAAFVRLGKSVDRATYDQLRGAYAMDLRAHPTEAIAEIRGLMSRLDSLDYAEERLSLFSVLTAVPDVRPAMEELAHNDITTKVPPAQPDPSTPDLTLEQQQGALSWPPSRILPLMAYNYYAVATKNDPDLALDGTIEAIVAQADPTIRKGMATGFVTLHPELKPNLYASLSEKHIDVGDVKPMAPGPAMEEHDDNKSQPDWQPIAANTSKPAATP